jgi:type IV pilus assembly protein PilW
MNFLPSQTRRSTRGFSLVEMMVAVAIGLVLITVISVVYLNSRTSMRRMEQISVVQQSVRAAFEHMGYDGRMVGHLGCYTGNTALVAASGLNLENNFAVGLEGYEFSGTTPGDTYALSSETPTDTTNPADWVNSTGIGTTTAQIPLSSISGGASVGLTPGSDVLILRNVSNTRPVRLTAPVSGGTATTIPIETGSTGTCPDGSANFAGFCNSSYGAITTCSAAQAFRVTTAGTSLTLPSPIQGSVLYPVNGTEVFPMQTVVYYIKRSSSGTTTSLYRRVFDGAQVDPALQEQELIEGVENMQVRYGVDSTPAPDGLIDGDYVSANMVADWSRVVAIRISLLMKAPTTVENNMSTATSATLNGVTVTFPAGGRTFDRRTFTTTIALRNRVAWARPAAS